MANDSLKTYLKEIGKVALLRPEEEKALSILVRAGNEEARRSFMAHNLRLVVSIAKGFQGRGLDLEDLIQEGTLGLAKAVEKFDHRRKHRFSTYATWWIKQAIRRAIVNQTRTVRVPAYVIEVITRIRRTRTRLATTLGRTPTKEEVGDRVEARTHVNASKVFELAWEVENRTTGSLDRDKDDPGDPADQTETVDREEQMTRVAALMGNLTDRERLVLRKRFALGGQNGELTFREIGAELDLTRERVRQIEEAALRKLRRALLKGDPDPPAHLCLCEGECKCGRISKRKTRVRKKGRPRKGPS